MSRRRQRGQAAPELLALLPALVVLALVGWQLVAAAHVWLQADAAARAGAEAAAGGGDPERAALATLPAGHARSARVDVERRPGRPIRLRVVLRQPAPATWLPRLGPVAAEAEGP